MAVLWKCVDTIVAKCAKACVGCVELCQNLWWLWYEMCGYWYLYSCLTTVFSSTNGLASKYSLSKSVLALLRCSPIPGLVLLTLYQNQLWPHQLFTNTRFGIFTNTRFGIRLYTNTRSGLTNSTNHVDYAKRWIGIFNAHMALHNSSPNPGLVSPMPIYGLYKSSPNPDWSCVSSMPIWPYTGLHQTWIGLVNLQCQYGLTQVFTKPGLVFKSSMPIAMALHKSLNWSCASSMPIWPYTCTFTKPGLALCMFNTWP